jgi:hypothetical protein
MIYNKFFFSLVLLLSVSSFYSMEKQQEKPIVPQGESSIDSILEDPFVLQRRALDEVKQTQATDRALAAKHEEKIYNLCQIEWLAKTCKEFHINKLETENTKNFTVNTLSNIEAIIQKIQSDY